VLALLLVTTATAAAAVEAPVAAPQQRIAVMRTVVDGVDPGVGAQIGARLADAVAARTRAEVVSSEDIEALLAHERDKQLLGCAQESCLAEVADALGVDVIVQGRLSRMDGGYALSVTAIDSKAGRAIGRVDERWGGEPLLLLDVAAPAVDRLFADAGPRPEGTIALEGPRDGSRILVDDTVRGTAPAGQLLLSAGAHEIKVLLDGYEPSSTWVIVTTGSNRTIAVPQVEHVEPFYATWWFWSAVGGTAVVAVGGAVAAAALLGEGGNDAKTGVLVELNAERVLGGQR
jgi:hypothetical protein